MRKSLFIFCPLLFGSIGVMLVRSNNKASIYSQEYRAKVSNSIGCGPGIDENVYAGKASSSPFCQVGAIIRTASQPKTIVLKFISTRD